MAPTPDEQALIDRFSKTYQCLTSSEIMLGIERAVCGCDYGCTSWTTRDETRDICERLGLGSPRLEKMELRTSNVAGDGRFGDLISRIEEELSG